MEWIKIENKPTEIKKYMCFVPDCKHYNEHWAEYFFNGKVFIDLDYLGRNRIVEVSHYFEITKPQKQ